MGMGIVEEEEEGWMDGRGLARQKEEEEEAAEDLRLLDG